MSETTELNMTASNGKSNLKIHFFYVAFFLISIIILMATIKWTELPKFTDYLSTAATITSLVLALLAIIYAYISNDSLAQTTGLLSGVASDAKEATTKVSELLKEIDALAGGANTSNEHLAAMLEELKIQMGSLAGTASTLDQQANAIAQVLPEIPKGLNQLGERIDKLMQAAPLKAEKSIKPLVPEAQLEALAKTAMEGSSTWGLFLMHTIYLSKKHGKSFDIKQFMGSTFAGDYPYGYLIALCSVGLAKYVGLTDNTSNLTITDCPSSFEECKNALNERINKQEEPTKKIWNELLNTIEAHFNN
jgi:hypothetical protein